MIKKEHKVSLTLLLATILLSTALAAESPQNEPAHHQSLKRSLETTLKETKVSNDNVIMMVEMIRHGSRAPFSSDFTAPWITETGIGELTDSGKRMEYYLGLNTRARYPSFFKDGFKYNEYFLRSTPVNRTLMSGMSHYLGLVTNFNSKKLIFQNSDPRLFPPQINQKSPPLFNISDIKFDTPLPDGFNPFPIYSMWPEDTKLGLNRYNCKPLRKIQEKAWTDANAYLNQSKYFTKMMQDIVKVYNITDKRFLGDPLLKQCYFMSDFAIMDVLNNPEPKIKEGSEMYVFLQRCNALYVFQRHNGSISASLSAGPILEQISTYFEEKTLGAKGKPLPLKFVLYSAHDTTLGAQLSTLGLQWTNSSCLLDQLYTGNFVQTGCFLYPAVGSNLVWELIEPTKGSYEVKVSYNGGYLDYCKTGKKDKSGEFYCTLGEFKSSVAKYSYAKSDQFCGLGPQTTGIFGSKIGWILVILCVVFLIYGIVMTFLFLRLKGEGSDRDDYGVAENLYHSPGGSNSDQHTPVSEKKWKKKSTKG